MRKRNATAEPVVLDTSALFTFLEDEPGADEVAQALGSNSTIIPWVTLLEVHYVTARERGLPEADARYAALTLLPARVDWGVSEALVHTASWFKAQHRISLADALVAAYAKLGASRVMHKDPDFEMVGVPTHPLPPKAGD